MMVALANRLNRLPLAPRLWAWRGHLGELGLYLGAYLVYLLSRGLVFPDPQVALDHAHQLMALELALGIFLEPGGQAWAIAHAPPLVILLNWVYIVTYWPVILGLALVLYRFRRRAYYYYRSVICINLALALLIFVLFPLAPPLMIPSHFVDTIQVYGPAFYGSEAMTPFYNRTAALPSLHFSWSLILGVLFYRSFKGWFKVLGLLYPALTFFAVIITGNHYILDAVAGGALAGVAFLLVAVGQRRREPRCYGRSRQG